MADMALSLTKRAVEGTVSRVLVAIDEDTKLRAAAQQDLRFIVGEFQMMQSSLKVAKNNKESTSNEVKKTWVRQLRELAFDVEDCVEIVIHMDTTSARVRWSWVWRVVPLPSSIIPAWAKDLDRAVAQLKQLKARVEEVSDRNNRYNLLGSGDSDGSNTTPPPVPPEQLGATTFPSTVDILRDLWKANAKQSSSFKCNLKYLVTDGPSNERRVISVWRSAGADLEAADILNAAYSEICEEFEARARVKLMHPFNIQEFLKSLLHQLYVTSPQQVKLDADLSPAGNTSVVHSKLMELLSMHMYLIILEDLSSRVEWDLIRSYLPDNKKGSRIVISTKQLGIALSCTGKPYRVLQLAQLPNNDGYICAFYKAPAIDITELVKQLGQRRVISLWGDKGGDTACLVRDVYEAMKNSPAKFKGVNFDEFKWVNVPTTSPFSLEGLRCGCSADYCRESDDARNKYCIAEYWSKEVCKSSYLIVIEGLQSKKDWDEIKAARFVPRDTKSCIVIIANEEEVAQCCQRDSSSRKMDDKKEEEAAIISPLFAQKVQGASSLLTEFIQPDQRHMVRDIIKYDKDSWGVFAVWGATGVGKSALVRFLYDTVMGYSLKLIKADKHPLLGEDVEIPTLVGRFQKFGWVDVPDPFDLAEFSRRLLLHFNSYDPEAMEKTAVGLIQGDDPFQQCYEIMRMHRCLVVIDGLRSKSDWDSIKQAFWCGHGHPQSRILVITIEKSVAEHCVTKDNKIDEGTILPMKALDDKLALDLFTKVVDKYQNDGESYERKEREWSTEQKLKHANGIIPKCGGLPKIIDAVAKSDRSFWENINDDIVTKLKNDSQFDHLRGVLSWMHSYFDGCSDDSVKPCIFYLSVFPTNHEIRKAHLLRRWIAEGYCREKTGCSAKKNAKSLFQQLIDQDIIREIGSMPVWHINGFFREYIISQEMEDNLVFALEGQCKPISQRKVQHLSIKEDWEREKYVFESIDVSRLRSLTVFGKWEPFFISDKMRRIRVLDLEGVSGVKDCCLERIFEILLSLKFICLRGCKSITYLPKTLGGLRQLETLDVSDTSIVTLPWAIIKLQKIQCIWGGRMFLRDEDCTSAASDAGEQNKLTTATPQAEGSDYGVVDTRSPAPLLPRHVQDDAARQKKKDGRRQPSGTTTTPEAEGSGGGLQGQHQHPKQWYQKIKKVGRRWSSQLSPLTPCSWFAHHNGGVDVPVGIVDMPALHTLGTVNISRGGGKAFLKMFKLETTLPQLLKLSVCGINNENWKDLCVSLLAHNHLESLSLGLDKDFTKDIYFGKPPKDLKSFKVYGHIHRLPEWIRNGHLEANLKKFDIEVIISRQECMDLLVESLPRTRNNDISRRLCIKPTRQVGDLKFKKVVNDICRPRVLKIDCSSNLKVDFESGSIAEAIKVLIIHFSQGPDFCISLNESGLNSLNRLETVWLKGYDEKEKYVEDLMEQTAAHPHKPVFKFEKLKSEDNDCLAPRPRCACITI